MTNLEMEQRIQAMDEELAFQIPIIDIEEDIEFSVIEDESFFITEKTGKEPVKRSNSKKVNNTPKKAEKLKNEASDAATDAKKEPVQTKEETQNKEKVKTVESTVEESPKKTPYMEGSETPTIKIIPFVTETNTKEESFDEEEKREERSKRSEETEIPAPTEEFFEEIPTNHETETAFTGEVDKEYEDNTQKESFFNTKANTTEESNVFRINIPEFNFGKIAEISKQALSAVAVLAIFFLCTSTYSYYIEKQTNIDSQAQIFVEETAKKAEDTVAYYEEQAKIQKAELNDSTNTTISASSSNKVKLERLMKKESEVQVETKATRFQSLSDLTAYINDNTILLNDILENSEKKYNAGVITAEEYGNIISQAKDKLAELSTLLTTNRAVYNQEECIEDYDILYDNINIVNEIY